MILWGEYIDRFILSEDMKSYLKGLGLPEDKLVEIIFYSPVQIKDKKEAFRELIEQARADDEVIYTNLNDERYRSEDLVDFYAGVDLNLPVPFRAGDIVAIDRYPFADTVFVLITDVGDNRDCCSLCGLSRLPTYSVKQLRIVFNGNVPGI